MSSAVFMVGDVLERLAELEDGSVDLVMSSPPFLALRSYLPADHPDKGREIGSEADPAEFVDVLCGLVDELARVLAPHGSMVFELGDTFAGSGGSGGDYLAGGWREGQRPFDGSMKHARVHDPAVGPPIQNKDGRTQGGGSGWPRPKSLALVPELFRIALAYGRNPLSGRVWWEGNDRWMVRNVVRWVRANPPVGALGDKFRPATSELVVFTRNPKRYFDLDAVRTTLKYPEAAPPVTASSVVSFSNSNTQDQIGKPMVQNPVGAPPLDWWKLSPTGYPGAHYAVYPPELCVIPIKSMCPERVCRECGEPSRRIVDPSYVEAGGGSANSFQGHASPSGITGTPKTRITTTVGWSDCGHDDWRRGMVLDPFAGTGTTLLVATGHGRNAVGIDLDERNADLAMDRVGPLMLEVV